MAQKSYYHGLVIGKFDPYHKGHRYLIEAAAKQCATVQVFIVDSADDAFPAEKRMNWILADCDDLPIVTYIIPDIYDDDNSEAWAQHTKDFFLERIWPSRWTEDPWTGANPQVIFSSENYGPEYARLLGVKHVMVDQERTAIPISATQIRENPQTAWEFIPNSVRGDLITKIVVMGPESSGTSTLADDLAHLLEAPLVAEYGRFFCESMQTTLRYAWHGGEYLWKKDDFHHIAQAQSNLERHAMNKSNGIIVCDTDAIATNVFYQFYCNTHDELKASPRVLGDLYIITNPAHIPFDQDGTRRDGLDRAEMYQSFIEECTKLGLPFVCVFGDNHQRQVLAMNAINETMQAKRIQRGVKT